MDFQSLQSLDLKEKTVILRADLNVPCNDKGVVTDTTRIDRLKPTIDYLKENNAKTLIVSHFGRPEGKKNPKMSLFFLTPTLEECWGTKVRFAPDCIGDDARHAINNSKFGEIVLLENVRFYEGEKDNDPEFSKSLAALGDIYINDAFSVSHRAHASTEGITKYLQSAAGLLMEQELNALTAALEKPNHPVLAVAGGSKISTKLAVLENLVSKVDYLVLGGGMANTFLYAKGVPMGKSLCEKDMKDTAQGIIDKAEHTGCEIILPQDVVIAKELKENIDYKTVDIDSIPENYMAIDIGPKTIAYISENITQSKTVVWNGPLGVFEIEPFDNGTNQVAQKVLEHTQSGECTSVAGGGDTVAALENAQAASGFSYISAAGGAFLEWLEGKELPGVKALSKT